MTALARCSIRAAALLLLCGAAASCSSGKSPEEYRDRLRSFLTDRCYAQGLKVKLTDKDNRSTPPTRYAAATGVAYSIRHHLTTPDGTPATLVTWVYKDEAALDAALPGWDELKREAQAGEQAKLVQLFTLKAAPVKAVLLLETADTSLSNVVSTLFREIGAGAAEALK